MWIPAVDSFITIDLPGERLRAQVQKIVDEDTVIVEVTSQPMAKSHSYKFKDIIACRRQTGEFNEIWRVVEERKTLVVPPPKPKPIEVKKPVVPERKRRDSKAVAKKKRPARPVHVTH